MRLVASCSGALLLAVLASGCKGSSTPVEATDLCTEIATLVCEADQSCCSVAIVTPDAAPVTGDAAPTTAAPSDCVTTQRDACRTSLGVYALDARTGYSADRAGDLVENLRSSAKGCWQDPPHQEDFREVFAGTGDVGADCTPADTSSAELMMAEFSCRKGTTCHLYLRASGEPMGVCEVPSDNGCSHIYDCEAGEWCNLPAGWQPGVWGECQPLRADGWECDSDRECESSYCDARNQCAQAPAGRFCATTDYDQAVLNDRPVAYWTLDDAASTLISDSSGNGHDGTGQSVTVATDSALAATDSGSASFNGTSSQIAVPAAADLDTASALSFECWFKPGDVATARPILGYGEATTLGPQLALGPAGSQLTVNFRDTTGASHEVTSAEASLAASTWYHAVAVYDGSTARLYLDGAEVGSTGGAFLVATDLPFTMGGSQGGTVGFLGQLDEVAIYNYALPASRIAAHRQLGTTGPATSSWPLFAWF